jgi:hypothetical protein
MTGLICPGPGRAAVANSADVASALSESRLNPNDQGHES